MKWQCDIEGLEDNWVDINEVWTLDDIAEFSMRDMLSGLRTNAEKEDEDEGDENSSALELYDELMVIFRQGFLGRIKKYIVDCHLVTVDGDLISGASALTEAKYGRLDARIIHWMPRAIQGTIDEGKTLGEGPGLNLSTGTETASS
jgi:hypothetical protein